MYGNFPAKNAAYTYSADMARANPNDLTPTLSGGSVLERVSNV
jgi:hypothetical protein